MELGLDQDFFSELWNKIWSACGFCACIRAILIFVSFFFIVTICLFWLHINEIYESPHYQPNLEI
jgi:hypothetical protein